MPGPCGGLKDRFGLAWPIVPADWIELIKDPVRGPKAMQAVYAMSKIDIAAVEAAASC